MEAYQRHREAIASLADPRFYPIGWIDREVWNGNIRTLSNDTSIIGFQIKTYPGGAKELHGMFAAGDLAGVIELVAEAEEFGRALKCDVATIESAEGWKRIMASKGYRPHQLRIVKEL